MLKQYRNGYISLIVVLKHFFTKIKLNTIFVNGYYLEDTEDFDKIVKQVRTELGV
ncbi:hypothetical protein ACTWQB_06115 [Piscibacillus sp. B03]|uniref:hypothetical protein n=1 Tax=Piscibacillus sp. B03 TaxID=3457430 RepID=UPI003FCDE9A4